MIVGVGLALKGTSADFNIVRQLLQQFMARPKVRGAMAAEQDAKCIEETVRRRRGMLWNAIAFSPSHDFAAFAGSFTVA
jgi:hypothetical protein